MRYYLSLDALKDASDVLLSGTRTVTALAPGQSYTGSRTVTVPSTTSPGTYPLLAGADDLAVVTELDETNNCTPPPPPSRCDRLRKTFALNVERIHTGGTAKA